MSSTTITTGQNAADFFNAGDVQVSSTSVNVKGRTYHLRYVDSVDIVPPNRLMYVAGAVIAAVAGVAVMLSGSNEGAMALAVVAAMSLIAMINRPYSLVLHTNRGDQQPLSHANKKFVQSVKVAIEDAIAQRG